MAPRAQCEPATLHKPIINFARPTLLSGAGRVGWVGVPMSESTRSKVVKVIGPFGPLTIADLPSPETRRWSIRRKAEVIAAVRGGLLSLEEACGRYALGIEEFLSWEYCIDRYGPAGLRATLTQFYLPNGKRKVAGRAWDRETATQARREAAPDPENAKYFAGAGFNTTWRAAHTTVRVSASVAETWWDVRSSWANELPLQSD